LISLTLSFFASLINRAIASSPEAIAKAECLNGQCIAIDVTGLPIKFYLVFTEGKLSLPLAITGQAQASVKGTPLSLLRLLLSASANVLSFKEQLSLEGEIEYLQTLKQVLQAIDIDWEEKLSHFMGDIPAHQLGNLAKDTRQWGQQSATNLRLTISEYLQEELQYFPAREQVEDFMAEVDIVRDDVERLQARYRRLQLWQKDCK
jgi:ubiquinone biosynthesis protein UbiJ